MTTNCENIDNDFNSHYKFRSKNTILIHKDTNNNVAINNKIIHINKS